MNKRNHSKRRDATVEATPDVEQSTVEETDESPEAIDTWSVSDPTGLDMYFQKLRELAPLSADEQFELARRYRGGDREAGELLLSTNLRLVVKIAREYCRRPDELLELIQEGNLGLVEALDRFEPDRGVRFTTYAQHWVRAMIMGYLINQKYPVRLGSSRAGRTIFYNLNKARRELQSNGEAPTIRALAEALDVEESDIMWVAAQIDGTSVSLDTPIEPDGETPMSEIMVADLPNPEQQFAERQQSTLLHESIEAFGEHLTEPRDRYIWFERTIADEPQTLRELGERFDVSKERIRQIEVKLQQAFTETLRDELPDLLAE